MRIAVFLNAPADVHFYKYIVKELTSIGHDVRVLVRDYGDTLVLAKEYYNSFETFSKTPDSKVAKMLAVPLELDKSFDILRRVKPDFILGGGIYGAYGALMHGAPFVEFRDGESRLNLFYWLQIKLYSPFIDAVITPESLLEDLGKRHVRVRSFKELAYLHPNHFVPNPEVYDRLGLGRSEEFALLRFNAFDAVHDVGYRGIDADSRIEIVEEMSRRINVFVSCEGSLPRSISQYRLKVPKHRIHDVIYYAKLVLGDTGTIITEAACLGTPAILFHSRAAHYGNFVELQRRYGLIFLYESDFLRAREKALELLSMNNLKRDWQEKRSRLLNDKIDMTEFMVSFVDGFPQSLRHIERHKEA